MSSIERSLRSLSASERVRWKEGAGSPQISVFLVSNATQFSRRASCFVYHCPRRTRQLGNF